MRVGDVAEVFRLEELPSAGRGCRAAVNDHDYDDDDVIAIADGRWPGRLRRPSSLLAAGLQAVRTYRAPRAPGRCRAPKAMRIGDMPSPARAARAGSSAFAPPCRDPIPWPRTAAALSPRACLHAACAERRPAREAADAAHDMRSAGRLISQRRSAMARCSGARSGRRSAGPQRACWETTELQKWSAGDCMRACMNGCTRIWDLQ